MSRTLLLELRDAAKVETDSIKRHMLRELADDLDTAIYDLFANPTAENLSAVNGHWAAGVRALGYASHLDPDGGGAKMKEAA